MAVAAADPTTNLQLLLSLNMEGKCNNVVIVINLRFSRRWPPWIVFWVTKPCSLGQSPMFRDNMSLVSWGSQGEPSKKAAHLTPTGLLLGLYSFTLKMEEICSVENSGSLRNARCWNPADCTPTLRFLVRQLWAVSVPNLHGKMSKVALKKCRIIYVYFTRFADLFSVYLTTLPIAQTIW
jgi:hypothetical protein